MLICYYILDAIINGFRQEKYKEIQKEDILLSLYLEKKY